MTGQVIVWIVKRKKGSNTIWTIQAKDLKKDTKKGWQPLHPFSYSL